ncbi:hypothetical protein AGMMS49990_10300 [Endomicrobiia bacterium]|nr:hypothetical protein AGMMS49990_10300 [Endomicrobiia bacterium]
MVRFFSFDIGDAIGEVADDFEGFFGSVGIIDEIQDTVSNGGGEIGGDLGGVEVVGGFAGFFSGTVDTVLNGDGSVGGGGEVGNEGGLEEDAELFDGGEGEGEGGFAVNARDVAYFLGVSKSADVGGASAAEDEVVFGDGVVGDVVGGVVVIVVHTHITRV